MASEFYLRFSFSVFSLPFRRWSFWAFIETGRLGVSVSTWRLRNVNTKIFRKLILVDIDIDHNRRSADARDERRVSTKLIYYFRSAAESLRRLAPLGPDWSSSTCSSAGGAESITRLQRGAIEVENKNSNFNCEIDSSMSKINQFRIIPDLFAISVPLSLSLALAV